MPKKPKMFYTDLESLINYTFKKVSNKKCVATIHEYPNISFDIEIEDCYDESDIEEQVEETVKEKMEELIKELFLKESKAREEIK